MYESGILLVMNGKMRVAVRLAVWLTAGVLGLAQEKPAIVTLVPTPEWQMTSSRTTDSGGLKAWGGDPAIESEYGVTAFAARTYRFDDHAAEALVEQAQDPSAAYGLWTFYRGAGMTPVAGMPLTVAGEGKALLVRGAAFIRVARMDKGALPEADFRILLKTVGGPLPSPHALEQLPRALPSRGLVQGSEHYVLGPVAAAHVLPTFPADLFGFEQGAEVQAAQYITADGKLTLAAINYPTPQIAQGAFDSIASTLGGKAVNEPSAFDYRRQDTYVLVVMNAPSRAAADRFLEQFKVSKLISQDQNPGPSERSEVVQLVQLLLANGILIMGLLGVSFLGGIFVFAGKRLARKWFADSWLVEGRQGGLIVLNLR